MDKSNGNASNNDNNSNLDKTLDSLKEKYGTSVIKKASSLNVSSKY